LGEGTQEGFKIVRVANQMMCRNNKHSICAGRCDFQYPPWDELYELHNQPEQAAITFQFPFQNPVPRNLHNMRNNGIDNCISQSGKERRGGLVWILLINPLDKECLRG
jgi:hypothetical protein